MTRSGEPDYSQCFTSPEPTTASASEGIKQGQELARRYLPEDVRLAAAIAFGDSDATTWTRLQAGRLIAQIAGATAETMPNSLRADGNGSAHEHDAMIATK